MTLYVVVTTLHAPKAFTQLGLACKAPFSATVQVYIATSPDLSCLTAATCVAAMLGSVDVLMWLATQSHRALSVRVQKWSMRVELSLTTTLQSSGVERSTGVP